MAEQRFTREEVEAQVAALGPWFHNLDLQGVRTAPEHFLGDYPAVKWRRFGPALPDDLTGRSVLDIGCNAGFYAMEMKWRGAARVLGVDFDEDYLAQARFAAKVTGLDIEFRRMSVYEAETIGERFDIVLFMGVLYHLRYPLLALDLIHAHLAKDLLVFQSMLRGSDEIEPVADDYPFTNAEPFEQPGFPKMHFVEKRYADDPTNWWVPNTNWWVPNRACVEAMLRSAGFEIADRPEHEVYICPRRERPAGVTAVRTTVAEHA